MHDEGSETGEADCVRGSKNGVIPTPDIVCEHIQDYRVIDSQQHPTYEEFPV